MEFTHEGIKIELRSSGDFAATVGGRIVRKPSLDAMRKFITLSGKKPFAPFTGLVEKSYGDKNTKDGLVELNVNGVEVGDRATKYRAARWVFITEGGGYNRPSSVMVNSPENRAAYISAEKYDEETSKLVASRRAEYERLQGLIKYIEANDYATK